MSGEPIDFLTNVKFRLVINRIPNVVFFMNQMELPGITLNNTNDLPNPFHKVPIAGDTLEFENLTLQFLVDEDLNNYLELFDWMKGIGFPSGFDERAALEAGDGVFSDARLTILSSHNDVLHEIVFHDMYPSTLESVSLNAGSTETTVTTNATFRYKIWDFV